MAVVGTLGGKPLEGKLTEADRKQLETLIGLGKKTFRLLYSIERDGCSAPTFHAKCDSKGPTATVLYNAQGTVFGGYTSMSWSNTANTYIADPSAILFQLKYNNSSTCKAFKPTLAPANAMYTHQNYGPTFGNGHDLYTFNGNVAKSGSTFPLNGSVTFKGYDMTGVDTTTFNNGNLAVTDLEVYAVADDTSPDVNFDELCEYPWRRTVDWESTSSTVEQLKFDVENYSPLSELLADDVKFPAVNILLIGPVGAGKSSFFNTITSVFKGKIFNVARSGGSDKSLTTKFTKYRVMSNETRQPMNFRLCDTRGLERDHLLNRENVRLILEGNLPDRFPLDPSSTVPHDTPGFKKYPELDDRIHCVVFCVDATAVDAMTDMMQEIVQNIKEMQTVMNSFDVPQTVVLTKTDNVCELVKEDPGNVYRSRRVEHCVNKVSEVFGLPRNSIFPMKNYEKECHLDDGVNILALLTLKEILNNADAFLFNHYEEILKSGKKSS